jgi:hypothetical protein
LPAAGILLLALLRQVNKLDTLRWAKGKVIQDLTILAAQIQIGTLSHEGDANYELLLKATRTIQNFLTMDSNNDFSQLNTDSGQDTVPAADDLLSFLNPDPWDLEIGFWEHLGEYSTALGTDPDLSEL